MSQTEKLFSLLSDQQPHRTDRIRDCVYGEQMSLARIAARIYDLKQKYPNVWIKSYKAPENKTLHYYQMVKMEFKENLF